MKTITTVLLAGLMLSGCVHRHVTVVESAPVGEAEGYADEPYLEDEVILEEECEPVWDGHTFLVVESHVHGFGCGHFFHHGCWHLHPFDWIYLEIGYSHCGDTGGFYYASDPWARVWDGCSFVMLHGHVHGAGCGHYYHHGCWNSCPSDYVYADHRRSHFSKSPPVHHSEMAVRTVEAGSRGPEKGSVRRVEANASGRRTEATSRRTESVRVAAPGRAARNAEAPGRRQEAETQNEPAARREAPPRREQPQRMEQPRQEEAARRREQPQRIEQPKQEEPRRREAPQRIEQPKRQEAPQRIEQPKKQEAPKRIEPPQRREAPKKEQPPQRREAPKEKEKEKRR